LIKAQLPRRPAGKIRGHRARGTGILNNELYIGRLIWNRLHYVKDPRTGRRISRRNDPDSWIIEEVPDLRIIEDELWERVKTRQAEIEARPEVQAIKASRFWEQRRAIHLLTGLVRCSSCGGLFTSVGRDYLACANARKLHQCDQRKGMPPQRAASVTRHDRAAKSHQLCVGLDRIMPALLNVSAPLATRLNVLAY